jgi:hypothetical protein
MESADVDAMALNISRVVCDEMDGIVCGRVCTSPEAVRLLAVVIRRCIDTAVTAGRNVAGGAFPSEPQPRILSGNGLFSDPFAP